MLNFGFLAVAGMLVVTVVMMLVDTGIVVVA